MSSEIRVNKINNRSGLSTVTFTNTGPIISGVTTFQDKVDFESNGLNVKSNGLNVTGGSVGIGTDNPTAPLHLSGADANGAKIKIEDNNNGFTASEINVANGGRDLRIAAPQDIYFQDVDTGEKHLYIESGGNIGINTTAPQSRLEVFTDDDTDFGDSTNTNNTNSLIRLFNKNGTDDTAVNNYVGIRFDVANGATSTGYLSYVRTGNNAGAFQFKARNGASSYPEVARILSSGGITFGGDTAQANALDDYEEGNITTWRLKKDDANTNGSNNVVTHVRYTKIGRCVYISGHIRTDSTESSKTGNALLVTVADATVAATLPFVPNHTGGIPITHTRTINELTSAISLSFVKDSATLYIYANDSTGDYIADSNTLDTNTQTNLVITFSGHFFTDS